MHNHILTEAEQAFSNNEVAKAATLYESVLALDANSADALFGLSTVEMSLGKNKLAYQHLLQVQKIILTTETDGSILSLVESRAGLAAYRMGDVSLAAAHWQRSTQPEAAQWLEEIGPIKDMLVSVLLYTADHAHFLRHSLRTVFEQSHRNIELIIVDDASVDDTLDLIKEFELSYSFEYIRTSKKKGKEICMRIASVAKSGDLSIEMSAFELLAPDAIQRHIDSTGYATQDQSEIIATSKTEAQPNFSIRTDKSNSFDLIVSLGPECTTATTIRRYFQIERAYPFDWWVTPIKSALRLLNPESNFELTADDLLPVNVLNNTNTSIYNKNFHIIHHHDFPKFRNVASAPPIANENIKNIEAKYQALFARLHQDLKRAQRPLFVIDGIYQNLNHWNPELESLRQHTDHGGPMTDFDVIDSIRTIHGERCRVLICGPGSEAITQYPGGTKITMPAHGVPLPGTPPWLLHLTNAYYRSFEKMNLTFTGER